jgi:hypothetical protein
MTDLKRTGLRLTFAERKSPLVALAIGLAFGAYMAFADATIFRSAIPPAQRASIFDVPVIARIIGSSINAAEAEVVLRLICMTALVVLFVAFAKQPRRWCYWLAIMLCALVAYPAWDYLYFASLAWSPLGCARELALHFAATTLWGWLYWRHGFLAALVGHLSAHLTLQPTLSMLIS